MPNYQYWASESKEKVVAACDDKTTQYYNFCNQNNYLWTWGMIHDFVYSGAARTLLGYSYGEQAEMFSTNVNELRNLIQHSVGIIINQRPTWEVLAINSDYTSLAQTAVAKGVLSYFLEVKELDKKLYSATLSTKKFGEGFIVTTWDQSVGKEVSKVPVGVGEDGKPIIQIIREGDIDCRVFEPVDVIRDVSITNHDQNHWYITRERRNKYDLAAKFPKLYKQIIDCTLTIQPQQHYVLFDKSNISEDLIYVYTLFHKKTSALPDGRIISYINDKVILSDSPMNYDDFPVLREVDSPMPNTNFSYTDTFDAMQIQDELNGLWSTILTNQRAFGVQNIAVPIGANIPLQAMSGGLNIVRFDPASGGKPEALQLCKTPQEVFTTVGMLDTKMGNIMGVNSTAQGNPPPGVESGVALSLLQSMNVQYQQGAQESYVHVMSQLGTSVINILKKNAKFERIIEIVGSAKGSMIPAFKGKDLSSISRVIARPGNPMTQTVAGRIEIAKMVTDGKMTAEGSNQFLTVVETGSLDSLTEGRFNVDIQIKSENQDLRDGKDVPILPFDDHLAHITEHQSITSDVNLRRAKAGSKEALVFANTTKHIMDHLKFLQDPNNAPLLAILGQAPAQPNPTPAPAAGPTANSTNIAVNGAAQTAASQGATLGNANAQAAINQPKPAGGEAPGQLPQGLIDIASKQPRQG